VYRVSVSDSARAVQQIERPVNQPGPTFYVTPGQEAPEHFNQYTQEASDIADEQYFINRPLAKLGEAVKVADTSD